MPKLSHFCIYGFVLTVSACSMFKKEEKAKPFTQQDAINSVPKQFLPEKYKQDDLKPKGAVTTESLREAVSFTRPDDIVWTDPDDPYGEKSPSTDLDVVLSKKAKGPWEVSYKQAFAEARRTGKPVLVWFTSARNSPNCQRLSREVFSRADFEKWTGERMVKLRLDLFVQDPNSKEGGRKEDWLLNLKNRYSVKGTPAVLMLTPNEKIVARYNGYKAGTQDFYEGRLKQAVDAADRDYASWKKTMESKGYRDWTDRRGRKVFAKLKRYDEGTLYMVEPNGRRLKTSEKKLSAIDQQWIAAEKAKRKNKASS